MHDVFMQIIFCHSLLRAENQLLIWSRSYVIDFFYCLQADEHESRTLDDVREKEPEFFKRVTSILEQAELDFGL